MEGSRAWLVAVAVAVAGGRAASAQERGEASPHRHRMTVAEADTNHDGEISYEEFRAAHASHAEERLAARPELREAFDERVARRFQLVDANADGVVTKAEVVAFREQRRRQQAPVPAGGQEAASSSDEEEELALEAESEP